MALPAGMATSEKASYGETVRLPQTSRFAKQHRAAQLAYNALERGGGIGGGILK